MYGVGMRIAIDSDIITRIQALAKRQDADITTLVNTFLREWVESYEIKPEVLAELEKEVEETERGVGVSPKFSDLDEAFTWLDK